MSATISHAGTTLDPARGPTVADMTRLASYADVDDAFKSKKFEQGGGGRRDSEPFVGHSLLALSGGHHFERRRIEAVLFRPAALRRYENEIIAPAWRDALRSCTRIERGHRRGELQRILRRTLCRLSAAVAGIDGLDSPAAVDLFLTTMERLSAGVNAEWAIPDHRDIVREGLEVKRKFAAEFFTPSRDRRARLVARFEAGEITREELPLDLLTIMLLHRQHFARWDEDLLLRELILFSGAPVSITVGMPHVVRELTEWIAAHPDDAALLADTAFLRAAIVESLRLRPASPYLIRRATGDHRLPSGRIIAAGEYVVLDLIRAGRDPVVFGGDADSFNPHRVPLVRIKPFGLGFGSGPHTCIAANLTMGDGSDADACHGIFVSLLAEFYRNGGRVDPDTPPRWNDATTRNEYAEFPVCFDLPQPSTP